MGMRAYCEEGVESCGVGGVNLPVKKNKHRATRKYSLRTHKAIANKQKKGGRKKRRRGWGRRRAAREAACAHRIEEGTCQGSIL